MRQTFVLVPPSLQITPPSGQVVTRKGGPVSFECRANGNPNPTVQWSKRHPLYEELYRKISRVEGDALSGSDYLGKSIYLLQRRLIATNVPRSC
ncbi:hypothetical protein HUJ04_011251 [Dendroctonus ponderosae]|nr:hypothetical protein HUJ04_011251 [Dendroctonus ponderosae]